MHQSFQSAFVRPKVRKFLSAGVALLFAIPLPSVTFGIESIDPLVITASRIEQRLSDVLPSTTVITRTAIEDSHASDLTSVLRRQAGLEIAQTGGLGANASLFMRGANSSQVLVLVDGMRINSVGSGAAPLAHLLLDQIDHIEIVRGNVSAMYGSDAIGGVVQIFTRSGEGEGGKPGGGIDAQIGGDRTRALSLQGGGSFGPDGGTTRVSFAVSERSVDGFSAIDPARAPLANPDKDGYRNTSASLQLAQQIGGQEIGARALDSHGRLDFDSAFDGPTQTHQERSKLTTASVFAKLRPTPSWASDLQYGESDDRSANISSDPFSFAIGTTENRSKEFSWNNRFDVFPGHTLTGGYENLDQRGTSTSYDAPFERKVNSALAGYVGDVGRHQLQVNLRHDDYSDFGKADAALAAYAYRFAPGWKAIAEVSNAFKAPSFNDLYTPFFGNRALKPERAHSAELGLQYAVAKSSFRASLFRTRTRDLIVYDAMLSKVNNVDRSRVVGLELGGATECFGWDVSGNLTLQRPIDEKTQQALLRRAHRNFNLAAAKTFGAWRITADVQDAGARYDFDIATFARIQLPSYTVADLGVRYTINSSASVGFELANAFDRRYNLVDGYNTPGRVATMSAALKF